MKVLLFVLFAGYAVRCDENNYYVIEMVDDPPQKPNFWGEKPFKVYWNVPTKQCKSKKIPFENLYQKFGIIQNNNDTFVGEKITILYDPGLFPALLKNETSGRFKFRNGGVPQEGDLNKHLEAFNDELDQSIPDKKFDGVAIIDFESWRPVYRQNFGVLRPYKDVSLEIERKLHWWWQKKWLEAEAKKRFEEAARTFMQTTIAFAKQRRPNALWGFYGFPYCFNMASNNMVERCAAKVPEENDDISWLWRESTALYPSVYSSVSLSTRQLTSLIRGRVKEASRFGRRILPYFWYRYRDAGFLDPVDLNAALDTMYKSNASGFIIWGSSNDVNTVEKCTKLLNYIEQVMGPAIAKYTKSREHDYIDTISNTTDESSVNLVNKETTNRYDVATTNSPTDDNINRIALDPEYHWIPPDNYTQAIKDHVEEEIKKKLINTVTKKNETVSESNVLIDLILNSIVNTNFSHSQENTTVSNVDSTYQIGENKDTDFGELQSSTTTEATKVVEAEITPVTTIVANDDDQILDKNNEISSTESATLSTTSIDDDTFIKTPKIMEYTTTSILPDMFTEDVTDNISKSKNDKKSFVKDSEEGYFDVTTETFLSTESTESKAKTIMYENIDYTTENNKLYIDYYTTEVIVTSIESIETTTKNLRDVLTTEIDKIVTSTTETTDSTQAPSQSTTLMQNNKSEYDSSTTELNVENVTAENLSTKAPIFKNNTKKVQLDLKENITLHSLSTKAPDFNGNTEVEVSKTQSEEEDTSLMSTSKSPEQVVVYV